MAKADKLKVLEGREKDIYEAGLYLEERRKLEVREERAMSSAVLRIRAKYANEYQDLLVAQRDAVLLVAGIDAEDIASIRRAHAERTGDGEQAPSVPVEEAESETATA